MPKNRRIKQREREKGKRAIKQENFDAKRETDTQSELDRKIFNGLSDLTPYNASKMIRSIDVDPEDLLDFGGRKWLGY